MLFRLSKNVIVNIQWRIYVFVEVVNPEPLIMAFLAPLSDTKFKQAFTGRRQADGKPIGDWNNLVAFATSKDQNGGSDRAKGVCLRLRTFRVGQ